MTITQVRGQLTVEEKPMQKRCDSKGTNGNELVQCAGEHMHDGLHHEWPDDGIRGRVGRELWWNGAGFRATVLVTPTDTLAARRANAEAAIASQKIQRTKCEACGERDADFHFAQRVSYAPDINGAGYCAHCSARTNNDQLVREIRARRAKLAESPKYYGVQPDVLPETLPAGTRTIRSAPCGVIVAHGPLQLDRQKFAHGVYVGAWNSSLGQNGVSNQFIDWSMVLVQETKPRCECTGVNLARGECGKCGRAARPLITAITAQAQADALFGAGQWCAGLAGAALVENETDETWCARQLAEYTGKPARCAEISGFGIDVRLIADSANLVFRVPHIHVRARNAEWFRAELAKYEAWPRAGTCQLENWLTVGSRRPARCAMAAGHDGRHADGKGSVWADCPAVVRPLSEQTGEELRATARLVGLRPDPYREHALLNNIDERVVGELTRAKPGQEAAAIRNFVAWSNEKRKPKATASSRELAKGHPVGWPSLEGSDEP